MAFDGIVAKKATEELQTLIGYKIDKIIQPDKNTVIFGIYKNSLNFNLLACISSNNYRLHLTKYSKKVPNTALNFCMLLRKHILGYKITNIYTKDLERIVFLEVENSENPNKPIHKKLIIELMGKHSNIILVDCNNIIIDSIRHTSVESNSQRDIYPTSRYIMPNPSNYDFSKNIHLLESNNLTIEINEYKNEIPKDYILVVSDKKDPFQLNYSLDDFYFLKESQELFKNYKNTLLTVILNTLKKYEKRLSNIDNKLIECKDMDKYKLYGELITANLYKIPSNTKLSSISVENYYNNNNILDISLDQKYSVSTNAKRFFKKYSKLKNALEIVSIQKEETQNDINYIESIIYEIQSAKNVDDIDNIYLEISENEIFQCKSSLSFNKIYEKNNSKNQKNINKKNLTSNKFAKFNPLKYIIDGYTIYVGRNNKENDYLTNKFASKSDIWFHTKDIHGSHVILKNIQSQEVPDYILYEAAKLAAQHSKAKNSSNVPVDYCLVRFVKKISGNKPGLVTYSNNQTIFIK